MYQYHCLNPISSIGLKRFTDNYQKTDDIAQAEGVLVRSASMHEMEMPRNLLAVARAGAGVNNIPLEKCAEDGIVVFNTPGANANGVKELVIAGMLLASRDIVGGIKWVEDNKEKESIAKDAEKEKKNFAGTEIAGKKLGIIGLGAIGAKVANSALGLGMEVLGYDPFLSVNAALKLSTQVKVVKELDDIYKECDYITIHIPYIANQNKGFINAGNIKKMKDGVVIINCARGELVDNADMIKAVESGKVSRYVVDFPADEIIDVPNIVCIPHLGASTPEAEDNCAVMAAKQLIDYIENGNIVNSVNYPSCSMPRTTDLRLVLLHKNISNILAQITGVVGNDKINIKNMSNQSKGEYAVTIIDVEQEVKNESLSHISAIDGMIKVRVIK